MSPELFRRIGQTVGGALWQDAVAAELKVRNDTVRYWANGRREIPDFIPGRVRKMLDEHIAYLQELRDRLPE